MSLCECGCGQVAPLAKDNNARRGYVKGKPHRFVLGHANGGKRFTDEHRAKIGDALRGIPKDYALMGVDNPAWKGDDASYAGLHAHLRAHYPKTGTCERCRRDVGATGMSGTQYALIHGRSYSRHRDDYLELCPLCHNRYDREQRIAA